jgi:hypothetical protein
MTGLEAVVAIAQGIGAVVSAVGVVAGAAAQANAAEYEAKLADRNAQIIRQQTDAEVSDQRRQNRRRLAAIRAQYGASGLDFSGSALDVLDDSALEAELDVSRIKYQGSLRALEQNDRSQLKRMEAKSAWAAAPIGVASSLLGGVTSVGQTLMQ